jgi:lipopolysaccharide/colanic/teichoic acid biosynthesis glycosyltransferase
VSRDYYKPLFDYFILVIAHVILFPLFLLLWATIPLAIWLNDRGPIFYAQTRLGKEGKPFKLYKFRSMIPDAERVTGAVLAGKDDLRITSIGKILRKRALDELPQVINMWKGDISLVGPRPERPELLEGIILSVPNYKDRLKVKPGLTGVAQIYGRYATCPRHKLMLDKIYMKSMSPCLDVKLLVLSVTLTLKAKWQELER